MFYLIFFFFYLKILTSDESKNTVNSQQPRLPFLRPKPSTGSSCCTAMTKSSAVDPNQCPGLKNKVMCCKKNECKEKLSASISTQILIESFQRSQSPVRNVYDDVETATAEIPHEIRSLLPPSNNVRAISPTHLVVFPPEIPPEYRIHNRSKTSSPQPKHEFHGEVESQSTISSNIHNPYATNVRLEKSSIRVEESTITRSTIECLEVVESNVPEPSENNDPNIEKSDFAKDQPTDVRVTEPVKNSVHVNESNRTESPLVTALKTAPERCYSPLPSFVDASEFIEKPRPVVEEKPMTMTDALSIAPDRSYKLPESNVSPRPVGNNPVRYMHGYNKKSPAVPLLMTRSLIYTPESAVDSEEEQIASLGLKSFPPVSDELKMSTAAGDFDRCQPKFEFVAELVFDEPKIVEPEDNSNEEIEKVEPLKPFPRHPFTASGLHEPSDIPRYQQSIPENPHRAITPSDKSSGKSIGPGIKDKVSTFSPKASIKNTSFLKQEPNVHAKVAPILGYKPSSLDDPKPVNTDSDIKSNNVKTDSSDNVAQPISQPLKESTPVTPKPSVSSSYSSGEPVAPMPKTSLPAALLSKKLTCLTKKQQPKCIPTPLPVPDIGGQPTGRTGASAGLTAPKRGRGVLNPQNLTPGARVPLCGQCNLYIR